MKRDIDTILKQALAPADEPDMRLNQNILYQAKEMTRMAKRKRGRIPAAILAAAMTLAVGSIAVFAAWKYLSPSEMAKRLSGQALAEAFQSENGMEINETQQSGDYRITLLGIAAGEDLGESVSLDDGQNQIKEDRLYAALAIERADGTPMPDTSDEDYGKESFLASPYIKGLDPAWYNVYTLGGGYGEFVENGIQYRMLEVDNLQMFADQGVYIGVSSGTFFDREAYEFDENSGEITRNEDYEGVNALFSLPLDPEKADPEAAQEFLAQLSDDGSEEEPIEMSVEEQEIETFVNNLTAENLDQYMKAIESTVQVCKPDENGAITYSWMLESGAGGESTAYMDQIFPDGKPGTVIGGYSSSDTLDSLCVDVYTLNEDGTVTVAIYKPKTK